MIHAIVNPISGAGADPEAASRRERALEDAAARRNVPLKVTFTTRQGHARELATAAIAARVDGVIVWGGDGTFNEAASGLVGTSIPVGLVPAGSGNGLARALGMPRDPQPAIATAFDGTPRAIDVGRFADRYFFNIAGVGFDARVATLFNQRAPGSRGGWPYIVIGVREGCRYCASDYRVTLDGELRTHRALVIAFANGREYGLGARIAPEAELDDGLLDVLIAADRGVIGRFWEARHLARGTPQLSSMVTTARVRRAIVETEGPMEFHVDGEPGVVEGRAEVEVLPLALSIRSRPAQKVGR